MKAILIWTLGVLCLFSFQINALAETRQAATAFYSDVNIAVNGGGPDSAGSSWRDGQGQPLPAADGDIVRLLASSGTVDWGTNQLLVKHLVSLQGAGMNNTVIASSVWSATISFVVSGSPNYTWGLSGLTINKTGGTLFNATGGGSVANPVLGESSHFRMTDVKLNGGGQSATWTDILGVVDHCALITGGQWSFLQHRVEWQGIRQRLFRAAGAMGERPVPLLRGRLYHQLKCQRGRGGLS